MKERHSPCEVCIRCYVLLQLEEQLVLLAFVTTSSNIADTGVNNIVVVDFIDLHRCTNRRVIALSQRAREKGKAYPNLRCASGKKFLIKRSLNLNSDM